MVLWVLPGTILVSQYQKGKTKTNLDFLQQETVSGSSISWATYKYAPRPIQITMTAPHHSFLQVGCPPATQPMASIKALLEIMTSHSYHMRILPPAHQITH